ncbi:MAG: 50S ribosomal protein L4 [Nanopusillaceae archaeon]
MTIRSHVYDINGNIIKSIDLPPHFEEEIRPDLLRKAVYAIWSNSRQPYGAYEYAGLEAAAWTSKRRRSYRTSYGFGISRVPRSIIAGRWGYAFAWIARIVPNAVKGRRAHPPKSEKNWKVKINKKEKRKAIRSAIAATIVEDLIKKRYRKLYEYLKDTIKTFGLPLIISDIENIKKAKELRKIISNFNLEKAFEYINNSKRNRSGKGKRRGRRIKKHRGFLLVVSANSNLSRYKIDGLEIENVNRLDAEKLAPGGIPGRFVIWSEKAIEELRELYL